MKRKNLLLACLVVILLSGSFSLPVTAANNSTLTCTKTHTVQRAENIRKIAKRYQVSWRWLAVINKLANADRLQTGQKLCVQLSQTVVVQPACTQYHTVQRGEYLAKIARQYNVSWRWLAELNRLDDPSHLFAGNRLCVGTGAGSGTPPQKPDGKVIPTFTISRVDPGNTVTVQTSNFPANDTFNVYMGQMGTKGVNGILAGTIESGKGGSFTVSFVIPAALHGNNQIAIRLESPTSGYFAYNWFYNR